MNFLPGALKSYFVVLIVDIAAFLTGTALGWSSPITAIFTSDDVSRIPLERPITNDESSWIGSLSALGGIIGPPIFGYLNEAVGRKWSNTLVVTPYLCAYLVAAFAKTIWLFYVSRIFMGMGVGGVFTIINVYVAEVSEPINRGILISTITVSIMAGILFSNIVGAYSSVMVFNLILSAICLVFFPVFLYVAPESPLYSIRRKKDKQALKTLEYLRGKLSTDLEKEVEQIKDYMKGMENGSFLDIFKTKASIKALTYSVILTNFQQFSGINVIYFFTVTIFHATGSDLPPEVCSIIVAAVQVIASIGAPLSVDRFGRRRVLFFAITGAVISEVLLGLYFFLQDNDHDVSNLGWLPIFAMVTFIAFYNVGMGGLPWVIMSEILPTNVVSPAAATTTAFYWFTGFFLTKYFGNLSDAITMAGSFWLFAGFGVMFWLFVYFLLFETRGKTFKEIQEILNK